MARIRAQCVSCGTQIVGGFWSNDLVGYDTLDGEYKLFCSKCGRVLCVQCCTETLVARTPLGKHLERFGVVPALGPWRTDRFFFKTPHFLLCKSCMKDLGITYNSDSKVFDLHGFVVIAEKVYEATRRIEELAQLYEAIGRPEKAGETRERLRQHTVKHLSVDLNALLEKVAAGGLSIPYKCRNCGATLAIDGKSKADGITTCSYCGSATDVESVTALLKLALG